MTRPASTPNGAANRRGRNQLGVDVEVRSYSAMTDEELAKASEKFTEEEKIGALYHMIHLANDLGMCFKFNCKKHLVMYERGWLYSDKMNSKSVTDIEAAKGSEILGAVSATLMVPEPSGDDDDSPESDPTAPPMHPPSPSPWNQPTHYFGKRLQSFMKIHRPILFQRGMSTVKMTICSAVVVSLLVVYANRPSARATFLL